MAAQAGRGIDRILQEVNTLWDKIPDRARILFAADRFTALDPASPIERRLEHARSFVSRYRRLYGGGRHGPG